MSTTTTAGPLTDAQLAQFRTEGYLVVPDILTPAEADHFIRNSAVTPEQNNLGGFLRRHVCHPEFARIAKHPRAVAMVRQILGGSPRIVQSMYLDKMPGARGIPLHQDNSYLPNDPPTLMACWIALTDTDGDNGGFCVVPRSHTKGVLGSHPKVTDSEGEGMDLPYTLRDRQGKEWKVMMHRFEVDNLKDSDIVRLKIPRGSGVLFNGFMIHGSFANHTPDRPRLAFTTHYVHPDTWVFRTDVQETVPAE